MNWKPLLCASVSTVIGLAGTPALAQTAPAKPQTNGAQGAPMPEAASDQSVNPASPQTTVQDEPATEDGDIVVTGLRRSLESAQAIKKNSDGIVDAVVAEDIGKLPDTFASSALQRVAGVAVTRGGGESAGVTVRGLPDLSTTYNGREIFTAEGRFVAIQDFPAGTVAALEVYKSSTANLIEGGIAGQVNVRGRKPFDFNGFELSGSANGVAWEQSGNLTWNGNLLVSDRWDTGIGEMGLLVNASYVGLNFLDSTREQSLVIGTTNAAQGVAAGVRFPDAQALYYGGGKRWRPSANAAFQWRPSSELEFYVDGLYQGFRSRDSNRFLFVPIFGDLRLSNLTLRDGTTDQAQSLTVANAVRPDGFWGSYNGKTDTYQGGGGAIWKRGGLQLSADVAYTNSKFTLDGVNIDHAFASSPTRNVNFDAGDDGGPTFEFLNFNLGDPANYIVRGFFQEYLVVSGKDWQSRADATYDFDGGFLRQLKVGVRYNDRDAARDRGAPYIYTEPNRTPITALPVELESTNPGFDFNRDFTVRTFTAIDSSSIRDNLAALRAFFGAPAGKPAFNPTENFRANEKALALYGQAKYGFDLGNIAIDGLVGLRAIRTKTSVSGFSRVFNNGETIVPVNASNTYWDYLPNVSARVGLSDELQLRLAYTQTRTRPAYSALNPSFTLNNPPSPLQPGDPCLTNPTAPNCVNSNRRTGFVGNPNLSPLTSDNYDASLEWYFSRSGSLTGAIFRRDAKGFLATIPVNSEDPVYGPLRLDTPVNLGNTRLQGFELAFASFLDIDGLPTWAKGFGLQANLTYNDAQGDLPPFLAASLNNEQQAFPGVSKWTYNLVALYERPVFSARVAYNYRSKFAQYYSLEPLDPTTHAVIERGRGQVDFSTTVTPVPNITIAFDIVNLLGNPLRRYRNYDTMDNSYPRQILYLERTYSLGIRFRF